MAITLMCPNLRCRKILAVPDSARGSSVRCAYCQQILVVPKIKNVFKKTAVESKPDENLSEKHDHKKHHSKK